VFLRYIQTLIYVWCFVLLESTHDQNMLMLNVEHTWTCSNMWCLLFWDISPLYCIFVAQYSRPHCGFIFKDQMSVWQSAVSLKSKDLSCTSLKAHAIVQWVGHWSHSHVSAWFNLSEIWILSHYFFCIRPCILLFQHSRCVCTLCLELYCIWI
jgi:hypothetical protein